MRRAIMSLPVPLSPVIRTGTLAAATLPSRERTACMASERPKMIWSGGTSPSDCARELTESDVIRVKAPMRPSVHPHARKVHIKHQTWGRVEHNESYFANAQLMSGLGSSYRERAVRGDGTEGLEPARWAGR